MNLETQILLWIHAHLSHPALDGFFRGVSVLGSFWVLTALFTLQAAFFWLRRQWRPLDLTIRLGIASLLVNEALKRLVERPRPELWPWLADAQGPAFPSGHALGTTVYFILLAWLLAKALPDRKAAVWASCLAVIFLVGFSRLCLGVHWPTDVLGGWVLGGFLTETAIWRQSRCGSWGTRVEGLDVPDDEMAGRRCTL